VEVLVSAVELASRPRLPDDGFEGAADDDEELEASGAPPPDWTMLLPFAPGADEPAAAALMV
jgi:hypothetical protein